MEALARIDRTTVYNGRRFGLRDAAVLSLLQAGMTRREVSTLRCTNLRQHDHDGTIYVKRQQAQSVVYTRLNDAQTSTLLDYLEHSRTWCGDNVPLFTGRAGQPLTVRHLKVIEMRRRRSRS